MISLVLLILTTAVRAQLDDWDQFEVVWEDDFNTLDLTKWDHEVTAWGGGNGEFQVYTPDTENSFVDNGVLHIKPTLLKNNIDPRTGQPFGEEFFNDGVLDLWEMYGRCTMDVNDGCRRVGGPSRQNEIPPIMSARLRGFERFSFRYGRIVYRAKMPCGDWMWPALWMLPEDSVYGDWPVSGEIDIIEIIGNEDFVDAQWGDWIGIQKMGTTMHWGPDPGQNRFMSTHQVTFNGSIPYARNFHDYILDWSELGIRWFVDGVLVLSVPDPLADQNPSWTGFWDFGAPWNAGTNDPWTSAIDPLVAPFDREFHLLMNVAVGGTGGMIPDGHINRGGGQYDKPWHNNDGQQTGMNKFKDAEADWYWTWTKEGDDADMQVDYVRVYQRIPV